MTEEQILRLEKIAEDRTSYRAGILALWAEFERINSKEIAELRRTILRLQGKSL